MSDITTLDDVAAIYGLFPDGIKPQAFVDQANVLVGEMNLPYSPSRIKIIATYLAAHLIQSYDPQVIKEGDVSIGAPLGKQLDATYYGQQIKVFDDKGVLDTSLKSVGLYSL
jgi:hypothetical protein